MRDPLSAAQSIVHVDIEQGKWPLGQCLSRPDNEQVRWIGKTRARENILHDNTESECYPSLYTAGPSAWNSPWHLTTSPALYLLLGASAHAYRTMIGKAPTEEMR